MDLLAEVAEIRREVLGRRGRERFSDEFVLRVQAHIARRRAAGASMRELSRELGLALDTLYRWQRESPALRPVEVIEARREFVVLGPCGLRIEGLDVDGVAALLRKLA